MKHVKDLRNIEPCSPLILTYIKLYMGILLQYDDRRSFPHGSQSLSGLFKPYAFFKNYLIYCATIDYLIYS